MSPVWGKCDIICQLRMKSKNQENCSPVSYTHLDVYKRQPVRDEVEADVIGRLENMLDQMYFDKEAYISETVKLNISNPFSCLLPVTVAVAPGEFIEKMEGQESLVRTFRYGLEPDQKVLELFESDEIPPGYCYFTACAKMCIRDRPV